MQEYSGPTKSVKALSYMQTKTSLLEPFKKLIALLRTKASLLRPLKKQFLSTKSTNTTKSTKMQPSKSTKRK